jgi:hypothetical protein
MTLNRLGGESSRLAQVFLVTPEQVAHLALRKSYLSSVLSKHFKKVMQCGAITPPIMAYPQTLAGPQSLIEELLNERRANMPPPHPPSEMFDNTDIGTVPRGGEPLGNEIM